MAAIRLSHPMPPRIFTAILGPILETDISIKNNRFSSFVAKPYKYMPSSLTAI